MPTETLYDGPYHGRGAWRKYDSKVNLKDHRRFRMAYLLQEDQDRRRYGVLFSTDLEIAPVFLDRCSSARFQIAPDLTQAALPINRNLTDH